jgi:tRNA(fMet)-specific endonuclease VapC
MYLLDTNICIYALNGKHPALTKKLLSVSPDDICISSITVGELEYGAAKSKWSDKTRQMIYAFLSNFTVLSFDETDALLFGRLRAKLAADGTPIGAYDVMIAAQGVNRKLTVVTHNTKEFSRVPGITLEDWVE